MTERKLLAIYLNDHHAASLAGHEVAKRSATSNEGNEFGDYLDELVTEIEGERTELENIMRSMAIRIDRLKSSAAWVAEKAGRLKLNGRLRDYSPLSRLIELESLFAGINAKLGMWRALRRLQERGEDIPSAVLPELIAQGEAQLGRVEDLRLKAVELL